jgi:hypothetical protein
MFDDRISFSLMWFELPDHLGAGRFSFKSLEIHATAGAYQAG